MKYQPQVAITNIPSEQKRVLNGNKRGYLQKQKRSEYSLILIVIADLLFLNGTILGYLGWTIPAELLFSQLYWYPLLGLFAVINIAAVFIASFSEMYQVFEGIKLNLKIKDLFWSTTIFFGIVSLVYYQFFFPIFQVHFLLPAFLIFFTLSASAHIAMRYFNQHKSSFLAYAVVGGSSSNLRFLEKTLVNAYGRNTFCVGRFASKEIPGVIRLGGYRDIPAYLKRKNNFSKLLYFDSDLSIDEIQKVSQLCRSRFIDFEVVPQEISFFDKGIQVEQLAHLPILRRKKEPLYLLQNRVLKRTFDVIFSALVILLIFPWLFPIIALLIKLESRGPVFFKQYRTGYWNKPFRCYKFRSMRINNYSDKKQAVKNDKRITRIGSVLRRTNLDELPQFFNVFWGDMSVVGPRPHMLKHTSDYARLIDTFMIRHEVKPGITGWAQVNGWRGPTEEVYQMAKRVEYDVKYIENWNFWFDCKIILMTLFNMVRGEENAF